MAVVEYSMIRDPKNATSVLDTCDFSGSPLAKYADGSGISGYLVFSLKGEALSGRGIKEHSVFNPKSKLNGQTSWEKGYHLTVSAYRKLCDTYNVAENIDERWF